jgi:hypothetical protein
MRSELKRAFQTVQDEGQGVWQFALFGPQDIPELIAASMAGDAVADRWLLMLGRALREIPRAKPSVLCLLCEHEFSRTKVPMAFVALTASIDDPGVAIVNGLCLRCYMAANLADRVTGYYRDKLIPGLRRLPPFSAPGRA